MTSKKKKKQSNESKLIYIPFIALAIVAAVFFALPSLHSSNGSTTSPTNPSTNQPYPFFQFAKVSDTNYAGNNTVQVYFISWYGCPLGASDSWGVYIALTKYGIMNVTPNYSDFETIPISSTNTIQGEVPGLIFNSFAPKSNVDFHPIYLLGRIFTSNSTASLPNDTIISYTGNSLVNLELNELQKEAPSWAYNLIYKYQIQTPYAQGEGIAYLGNPPHIASTIIITGPNGTWMMIGYDQQINAGAPGLLAQYASTSNYSPSVPEQLLQNIQAGIIPPNLEFIKEEGTQISTMIQEAM